MSWPSFPDELPDFDVAAAPAEPLALFRDWLEDAGRHVLAPHAVTLSTLDADGTPDARVVVLRGVDASGFAISTSADSPKGRQLDYEPRVALTFFWPGRGRQVRARGCATACDPATSARDFRERSPASRTEILIGRQSDVLRDPGDLASAAADAQRRLEADPELVPLDWTRYQISPDSIEFWQARHDRRHVRLRYRRTDDRAGWTKRPLWP